MVQKRSTCEARRLYGLSSRHCHEHGVFPHETDLRLCVFGDDPQFSQGHNMIREVVHCPFPAKPDNVVWLNLG